MNATWQKLLILIIVTCQEWSLYPSLDKELYEAQLMHALNEKLGSASEKSRAPSLNVRKENKIELTKPRIFISLGANCASALHFDRRGLSEAFFPFDWCISSFNGIYNALDNDFKDFLKLENLLITKVVDDSVWVCDTKYTIQFAHDFKAKNVFRDYEHVKNKYYRRIDRLYTALALQKEVFFFRTFLNKEEAIILNNLISKKFPTLKYTLVVISNSREFKKHWGIKNIRNFRVKKFLDTDMKKHTKKKWDKIFRALNI